MFATQILVFLFKVTPVDMVNIAKWIHVPYKIAKAMMPTGFSEKFRLHDRHFIETLTEDINIDDIPVSLGGNDAVSIKWKINIVS